MASWNMGGSHLLSSSLCLSVCSQAVQKTHCPIVRHILPVICNILGLNEIVFINRFGDG